MANITARDPNMASNTTGPVRNGAFLMPSTRGSMSGPVNYSPKKREPVPTQPATDSATQGPPAPAAPVEPTGAAKRRSNIISVNVHREALKRYRQRGGQGPLAADDFDFARQVVESRIGRELFSYEKPNVNSMKNPETLRTYISKNSVGSPQIRAPIDRATLAAEPVTEVQMQKSQLNEERLRLIQRWGMGPFMKSSLGSRMTDEELYELMDYAKLHGYSLPQNGYMRRTLDAQASS